jgi:hypothetical protein
VPDERFAKIARFVVAAQGACDSLLAMERLTALLQLRSARTRIGAGALARACALGALWCAPHAHAQWTDSTQAALPIAARTGEQVLPQVAATPDGGAYIAWFDNFEPGYDVYLQRVNALGEPQWLAPGLLVADRALSVVQDYTLVVDDQGFAVLCFGTDGNVAGAPVDVAVQRVSPQGVLQLPAGGARPAPGGPDKSLPQLALLSDGSYAVGWSVPSATNISEVRLQRMNVAGQPVGALISLAESGRPLILSDIQAGGADGSLIALWVRAASNSFTAARSLQTQKFSSAGVAQWNGGAPVVISGASTVQFAYYPPFLPDGQGGAVFAWHESAGDRNAYLQRVSSAGALRWASPLATSPTSTSWINASASLAFDPVTQHAWVASSETSQPVQSVFRATCQRFDAAGNRLWGPDGVEVVGASGLQTFGVQVLRRPSGAVDIIGLGAVDAINDVVWASGVSATGTVAFQVGVAENSTQKDRVAAALGARGNTIIAWSDGPFGVADIQANSIRGDSTLGGPGCTAADLASAGQLPQGDGELTADDLIVYVNRFFAQDVSADLASAGQVAVPDGEFTADDLIVYVGRFFAGCR